MLKLISDRINKEQFEPTLLGIFINPFFIARKGLLNAVKDLGIQISGKTLDVGCGTKPYEKYFKSSQYIGLEIESTIHRQYSKADFFYDGNKFPFAKKEFDSLVTNQVFEHVFNPYEFMKEINRVLKPNGRLLITVPFVWDEHEQPYDFARYSSFGLKFILEQNGFEIIELKKSIDDFKIIVQLLNAYIYKVVFKYKLIKKIVTFFITSAITLVGIIVASFLPKNNDLYLDNIILAKKIKDI